MNNGVERRPTLYPVHDLARALYVSSPSASPSPYPCPYPCSYFYHGLCPYHAFAVFSPRHPRHRPSPSENPSLCIFHARTSESFLLEPLP